MNKKYAAGRRDPRLPPIPQVYTAGAIATGGNRGPGASVIIWKDAGAVWKIVKGALNTTVNREELKAVKRALEKFPPDMDIIIHCNSDYVVNGMRKWRREWVKNDWKTRVGQPVANRDLWEPIIKLHEVRTGSTIYSPISRNVEDGEDPMNQRVCRLASAKARAVARRAR